MGAFYFISGNEEFSVKERAIEKIRELCGESFEDNPALEIIRGDVDTDSLTDVFRALFESLETPSFLSPDKVVWLKHFTKFEDAFAEPTSKKKPSNIDRLISFLQDGIPYDVTFVMDCLGLDRRKTFFKTAASVAQKSGGQSEWFEKDDPKVKGFEKRRMQLVQQMFSKYGKRIEDSAASFLVNVIGTDEARLSTEVQKLLSYTEGKSLVTLADCNDVSSRATEALGWEFSSALIERDATKALNLIPHIMESLQQESPSGNPEMAIVYSVMNGFRDIVAVKCEGQKLNIPRNASADYFYRKSDEYKRNPPTEKSAIFSMHPYRAFKLWESATRFSDVEIVKIFRRLVEVNRAMVSTGTNSRLMLELLALEVSNSTL